MCTSQKDTSSKWYLFDKIRVKGQIATFIVLPCNALPFVISGDATSGDVISGDVISGDVTIPTNPPQIRLELWPYTTTFSGRIKLSLFSMVCLNLLLFFL